MISSCVFGRQDQQQQQHHHQQNSFDRMDRMDRMTAENASHIDGIDSRIDSRIETLSNFSRVDRNS